MRRVLATVTALAFAAALAACGRRSESPSPVGTARALLALHGLVGKQPEDRSEADRKKPVDRKALSALFTDYASTDPFLADVYVGFLTGALARNQSSLRTTEAGQRATVEAGKVTVSLERQGGRWLISLASSIPGEIKRRALEEKARYESARAGGKAPR